MLVIMAGLPGTGKTTLARALAARLGGAVLSKDDLRHALFAPEDIEYSTAQDDFCMELIFKTAGYLFQRNPQRMIFLDGRTFSRKNQVARALQAASDLHQPWRILECVCSESTAKGRLESQRGQHPGANRDFQLYLNVKARFEPITERKTVINTDQPLEHCIQQAVSALA